MSNNTIERAIYRFTLDVQRSQSQVSLPVKLGDTARSLVISLADGVNPYKIQKGCLAVFNCRKPDGNRLFNHCIIEGEATVRYDFTEQTATCEGASDCDISIYGADGKMLTCSRFTMVVDSRVVYGDDIPLSESEKTAIDAVMLAEIARVDAEAGRVAAEEEREAAESVRAEEYEHMLELLQEGGAPMLERAEAATEQAQAAADEADRAAVRADAAALAVQNNIADVEAMGERVGEAEDLANSALNIAQEVNGAMNDKAPAYTYGTEDLEAGTSELETGKLHFVYE